MLNNSLYCTPLRPAYTQQKPAFNGWGKHFKPKNQTPEEIVARAKKVNFEELEGEDFGNSIRHEPIETLKKVLDGLKDNKDAHEEVKFIIKGKQEGKIK